MSEITLYSMPSSGNSYKVRLLLAHLGIGYRHIGMEYETEALARAHAESRLPFGKLPVLVTADGFTLPESNAILTYLAEGTDWLPADPRARSEVMAWLFFEQNRHEGVIAVRAALLTYPSRAHLATPERLANLLSAGQDILGIMERHLANRHWLVGEGPTIADIALYAYTHSAGTKGGWDMGPFPAINRWLDRVAALPGHVTLEQVPA